MWDMTIKCLETTNDPRWLGGPRHEQIENTYRIPTSDNGGVISARAEQITDNTALRKKIHQRRRHSRAFACLLSLQARAPLTVSTPV